MERAFRGYHTPAFPVFKDAVINDVSKWYINSIFVINQEEGGTNEMLAGQLKSMRVPSCHTVTAAAGSATAGTPLDITHVIPPLSLSFSLSIPS